MATGTSDLKMTYFLVEFDRNANQASWTTFEGERLALIGLREKEAARLAHVEVVLLMATSIDELRRTHPRYFPGELERQLKSNAWLDRLPSEVLRRVIAAQAS